MLFIIYTFFCFSAFSVIDIKKDQEMKLRETARLVLVNSQKEILLMKIYPEVPADKENPILNPYWVTFGGGKNENENLLQAAQRELFEETGKRCEIGPLLWRGEWSSSRRKSRESFFFVHFNYLISDLSFSSWEEQEKSTIKEIKWWSVEELMLSQEIFIPKDLPFLMKKLSFPLSGYPLFIDLSTPKE